ncbi:DUF4192 family protein [Paenarthrobacter sp. PH39-S1]|uniref:DUF4192 family protein n=1 Tax=Paenarthrobacter sp. PH39-S1 TaxID=3046204 RepID=UPI0024BA49B6|nr:DUF4192 family protein [Paenarthrobacter sp. PH39-S1]MDJ0356322.1 DUF4192 family protein [Paenarthrobacter sp. PH39-S1]
MVEALTRFLTNRLILVYDGFLVSATGYADYFCDEPRADKQSSPIQEGETSVLNTELVYRCSNIQPSNIVALPPAAPHPNSGAAVEHFKGFIEAMDGPVAMSRARTLWDAILETGSIPTDQQTCELIADFQIPAIRDRLIADIPGIDEPITQILMAQTRQAPRWSRVEWAELVLMHLYTHCDPSYVAAVLTAIGYISWWQGRGSKAIQFIDMALDASPQYRLAVLIRQMLRAGYLASWATDRRKAYRSL